MNPAGCSLQHSRLGWRGESLWVTLANCLQTLRSFCFGKSRVPWECRWLGSITLLGGRGSLERSCSGPSQITQVGLQHSSSNTAQSPLLLSCPTDPRGRLTHEDPCAPGLRHSTLPGAYLAAAPPLPCPRPPEPRGTGMLTPTSPTPVCTIFRPSSASSSAFTCSVDGEEMVRKVFPLHPRDPPRDRAKGYPRQLPTPCQLPSSAMGTRMYGESPLFPVPRKGHPTTGGGGREEQDQRYPCPTHQPGWPRPPARGSGGSAGCGR